MKKEKTDSQYLKEIAYFSRKTSNNLQFFFYLTIASGLLAVAFNVVN